MKKKSVTAKTLIVLSLSIFTNLHAANPVLEKVAEMINKQLPKVSSNGLSEIYEAKAENDTLVQYIKIYVLKKSEIDVNNKEVSDLMYNSTRIAYCAMPYDYYQKEDLKLKNVYVDSEYKYLFSFKVSKRDC